MAARPRIGSGLLIVKGQTEAAPPEKDADLSSLGKQRESRVALTIRLPEQQHRNLERVAFENKTSMQAIVEHALTRIGVDGKA